ncbi:MAG: DUF2911 domain-containing protein [Vicinamibacterales bacterium]
MAALCTTALSAQKTTQVHPGQAGSPHVRTEWQIDGANISIEYGRPALKGRPEATLMPAGQEWRTGADEATTLKTDTGIMFSNLHVNPGTYTLYTVPGDKNWILIISKKTGQWGIPYPKGDDYGRTLMTVGKTDAPVEQLTIAIDDTQAGATLSIAWGGTKASVPFTIMPKM